MTSSLLLTTLPPTPDADCTKRNVALPPLGVITAHPVRPGPSSSSTTPTTGSESECDSDAYDAPKTTRTLPLRQWTGTPIRAIVPLPRRKLGSNGPPDATRSVDDHTAHVPSNSAVFGLPCAMHSADFWDDTDSDAENEEEADEEEEDERSDEDCRASAASQRCSYQSITAAEGLSAWSFEELRVECYAQSLVARGTKPPPVVQPSLAIPPAFVPRFVLRS